MTSYNIGDTSRRSAGELWIQSDAQRRTALDAAKDVQAAINHINSQNFGIAKEWLEAALSKLPHDNGEHITWTIEGDE